MTENKKPTTKKPEPKKSKHVIVFDHARVDPSHCLTDGLFRPLKRQSYKGLSLDVRYKYKEYTFWWRNYCPLNITDQSVFLAVHRLASENGRVKQIGPKEESELMKSVRDALEMEHQASDLDVLVLETTQYEISQVMGVTDSGANFKQIKESLFRLAGVSFVIYKGEDETSAFWKANLIGKMAGIDGKIIISINPMLSKALAGGQSTFVDMREQRQLKSEVSKRLHVWLSSWIKHGESNKIKLDLLAPHVWGDECEKAKLRLRRLYLREAIEEINSLLEWVAIEDRYAGFVTIKRPKLK